MTTTGQMTDRLAHVTHRIDGEYVARSLRLQARCLHDALRENAVLRRMIDGYPALPELDPAEVREVYARLLRMSADYVQFTVPALRAASEALAATGDAADALWAGRLAAYAQDEVDEDEARGRRGHESWALADLADLGAHELAVSPPHPAAAEYGWYFVSRAAEHPYAILGAKSVLEELSVRAAGPILAGVRAAGVAYASGAHQDAARFLHHHGDLDVDHGRRGARDLRDVQLVSQRRQILEGAYVTAGIYHQLAHHYLA